MKYMGKQFGTGEPWTKEELLFNAMVWDTGTRMWGASKDLTAVMRRPEKVSDVVWEIVELLTPGGEFEVWSLDDGTPFPVHEQDPDDLAPEGPVTKWRWEKKFWALRVMREIWIKQCRIQSEWNKPKWSNSPC